MNDPIEEFRNIERQIDNLRVEVRKQFRALTARLLWLMVPMFIVLLYLLIRGK